MDDSNYQDIKELEKKAKNPKSKILKYGYFDKEDKNCDVEDPYYGGMEGFENIFDQMSTYNETFLEYIYKN
jgi:protein-tyrosine-phosphatase